MEGLWIKEVNAFGKKGGKPFPSKGDPRVRDGVADAPVHIQTQAKKKKGREIIILKV